MGQQLEQLEMGKGRLRKATARMEDLEEQLKIKTEFERQLSLEKSQLEKSVTNSKKAAQRMSQNVEELQWRIKNNFELPTEFYKDRPLQGFAKPSEISANISQAERSLQSSPITIPRKESTIKQRSFFDVSPEMLEITSDYKVTLDTSSEIGNTSDFSPCCDEVIEFLTEDQSEEDVGEYRHNSDADGDSLDEGLGDISSDEYIELLVEENEIVESGKDDNTSQQAMLISAKSAETLKHTEPDHQIPCRPSNNEKERRPSRISFETSL